MLFSIKEKEKIVLLEILSLIELKYHRKEAKNLHTHKIKGYKKWALQTQKFFIYFYNANKCKIRNWKREINQNI